VAGILEMSPNGKRRRPGYDPAERLPGQVAVLLRGFFCHPFSGSLFWRGWRPRDESHWGETPAWLRPCRETRQRDCRGRWLCCCEAIFVILFRGVSFGVAGVLETSPTGERRRPGCDPAERSPGQVAVLLRGFFCHPFLGSLFWRGWRSRDESHWRETPAWLRPCRETRQRDCQGRWLCCCEAIFVILFRGVSFGVAGVLEMSPIGERRRPGCDLAERPRREVTGAGGCAVARLLLSSFFGESLLAHFKLKFACSHSTGNFLYTFFSAMSLWCRGM